MINPATAEKITEIPAWDSQSLEAALAVVVQPSFLCEKSQWLAVVY